MWIFIARRFISIPPLLLAVSFITYLLLYVAPGDYFTRLCDNPSITEEMCAQLRVQYGLDGGFWKRYAFWLVNAVTFEFGYSFKYELPVFSLITERLSNTLLLSGTSMVASWGLAIPLGVVAAVYQGKWIDKAAGFISFFGLSIPRVFYALLALLFAAKTGWFPTGGMRDQIAWDDFSAFERFKDVAHHLVLPVFVVATAEMASHMRQMRAQMIETLNKDFVRTARAKGLSEFRLLVKYPMRLALNPFISTIAWLLPNLVSGSIIVAIVLSLPTAGPLLLQSLMSQDMYLAGAFILLICALTVLGSLVSDILLALVDPRIRLE